MPWGQPQQISEHASVRYWIDKNAKKLVEAEGSIKINDWTVTFYANEFKKFGVIAYKPINKKDASFSVDNLLEIRLETKASIPKFIPIERQKYDKSEWKKETFVEIDDGKDLIIQEFNQYQEYGNEPYSRKYARSSIVKAYDFLKQFLPEFESMIKDKTVAEHASKIVEKAQKL